MDIFGRLSDYEIFGHLTQGILLVAGIDIVFGTSLILGASWDVPTGVATVIFAYVLGHLVASPSSLVLERTLVRRGLKAPMKHLLSSTGEPRWGALFPGYFSPLPQSLRAQVYERLGETSPEAESAFWKIYPSARNDEHVRARLATFIRLYGFCRNTAFVGILVGAALLATTPFFGPTLVKYSDVSRPWLGFGLLIASWILFLRFLKFYRSYNLELIASYVRQSTPNPAPAP